MKLVTAIVQPTRFEAIKQVVTAAYVRGLTVTDVRGIGRQRGHTEVYRGSEYAVDLIPKVKIEIAVDDDQVDNMVEAIIRGARSGPEGKIGDGKIFVMDLEEVIRIRTGESGFDAI